MDFIQTGDIQLYNGDPCGLVTKRKQAKCRHTCHTSIAMLSVT